MALFTSRGYESVRSKLFMRGTVIAADLVVFLPAVYAFVTTYYASLSWSKRVPPTAMRSFFFFFSVVLYFC
jgi:alpha-1,3-glucosyltransferase